MMQRIEYTCDRCGQVQPADRMSKLHLRPVFIKPDESREAREILNQLHRNLDELDKDLCNDCAAGFKEWFQGRDGKQTP